MWCWLRTERMGTRASALIYLISVYKRQHTNHHIKILFSCNALIQNSALIQNYTLSIFGVLILAKYIIYSKLYHLNKKRFESNTYTFGWMILTIVFTQADALFTGMNIALLFMKLNKYLRVSGFIFFNSVLCTISFC